MKCLDCWKKGRRKTEELGSISADSDDVLQISAIEKIKPDNIISKNELRNSKSQKSHPRAKLTISIDSDKSGRQGSVSGVADSGAMSNLIGLANS